MKFFFKGSVFSIDVPSNVVMEGDTITITPIESFDTGACENECENECENIEVENEVKDEEISRIVSDMDNLLPQGISDVTSTQDMDAFVCECKSKGMSYEECKEAFDGTFGYVSSYKVIRATLFKKHGIVFVSMKKKVDSIVSACFNRRVNKDKCRAKVFDSFPDANALTLDVYFNQSWSACVFKARAKNLEAKLKGKSKVA